MPPELDEIHETRSLLIPAYGLDKAVADDAFVPGPGFHVGPYRGPEDAYAPLRRDEWHLVPRGTTQFLYGASALFNDAVGPRGQRRHIRLREAHQPIPDAAVNTCLMVEGLRVCPRRSPDVSDLIPGYAAWAQVEDPLRWISVRTACEPGAPRPLQKAVLFGRSGACAMFAKLPEGGARILLLEFHLLDYDADRPDLLQVEACATDLRPGDLPSLGPDGQPLHARWKDLIRRAVDGYRQDHGP